MNIFQLFLACLEAIQVEHILTDVDQNKLFSNIRDICEANIRFWTMYMFPMVSDLFSNAITPSAQELIFMEDAYGNCCAALDNLIILEEMFSLCSNQK